MSVSDPKKGVSTALACDVGLAYGVLTDFNCYFEWLDFLTGSRILAREGDLAIAEFLIWPFDSKLIVESIHSENELVVIRRISGKGPFREMIWKLSSEGPGQCRVSLSLRAPLGLKAALFWRPRYWSPKGFLQALESRVRLLSGELGQDLPTQTLIDISETDRGLVLWFQGKHYSLTPLEEGESEGEDDPGSR